MASLINRRAAVTLPGANEKRGISPKPGGAYIPDPINEIKNQSSSLKTSQSEAAHKT